MKKKNKKEDHTLCIKYASNCKYCPRYKKCEEELREESVKRRRGDKSESKRVRSIYRIKMY